MVEVLEALMVILFGVSWPINIIKIYKARTSKNYSVVFYYLIDIGYIFGITSKLLAGKVTYVLFFYIINFIMVTLSIIIYYRNLKLDHLSLNSK